MPSRPNRPARPARRDRPEIPRDRFLTVKLGEDELEVLTAAAAAHGLPLSTYVRTVALRELGPYTGDKNGKP